MKRKIGEITEDDDLSNARKAAECLRSLDSPHASYSRENLVGAAQTFAILQLAQEVRDVGVTIAEVSGL